MPLHPVDEKTLLRMLRYALHTGALRLHLRPGCRPLVDGPGGPRPLRFRQLTGDDTAAMAMHLLARVRVPARLRDEPCDAALAMALLVELPGEALCDVQLAAARGGLQLAVDLLRPLAVSESRGGLVQEGSGGAPH